MRKTTIVVSVFAALGLSAPASVIAAPVLDVQSSHVPATVPAGTYAKYTLEVFNVGDAPTTAGFGQPGVTVTFAVPAGLEVAAASGDTVGGFSWHCSMPDSQTATCFGPAQIFFGSPFSIPIQPGQQACADLGSPCRIRVIVKADEAAAPGTVTPTINASGGGSVDFNGTDPIEIGPPSAGFELTNFDGEVLKEGGEAATQAGSHPHTAGTELSVSTVLDHNGNTVPTGQIRDVSVKLPPGLIGNPQAVKTCTLEQLSVPYAGAGTDCPPESQVGVVTVHFGGAAPGNLTTGVYNMQLIEGTAASRIGTPALFGFRIVGVATMVYAKLRTGEDYGVTVLTKNAPQTLPVIAADFTFWGAPADASHDAERFCGPEADSCQSAEHENPKPLINLPTSCEGEGGVPGGPTRTFLEVTTWEGASDSSSFFSHAPNDPGTPLGAEGCNAVPFAPSLTARPTTSEADASSGFEVDLHIPQNFDDPDGIATAHLRDTRVTLPEGLLLNPAAANGLGACSEEKFGYTSTDAAGAIHTTPEPAECPNASKVATVEVQSPLLDHAVKGAAYVATPYDNPFGSLLALYIALDDPKTGIVAKLAGKVTPDPQTGQLSATFEENPQLPFEDFQLRFFGGPNGALRTPAVCGTYTTTSSLTPWSAPDSGPPPTPSDSWQISQGAGGTCPSSEAALSHQPGFDAGTVSPIAGAYSPLVMHLRRAQGSQQLRSLTLSPPPGLVAKLAGTPACPEEALAAAAAKSGVEEQQSPSCPAGSRVGQVTASAGAGPAPYHAPGTAYFAGPYKGAPLSLAIVTPAVAGPFDLGTVVLRTALYLNPATTEITAVSDPLPTILQGIQLDVRTVQVALDKPQFTLNPTSCDRMAFAGQVFSTLGQAATLSSPFQLGECGRLGFKPRLRLSLKGGTKRGKHPALTAVLTPRADDANIASISVALPRSEFLDQAHIRTICTRVQWAADACPAASVYGEATVTTPLLDYPLRGKVYLRSSDNDLPDVVPDFRGPAHQPIRLESAGRTDSVRGGIRNTFPFVPDAPFTKLVLQLKGGSRGLLVNSQGLCGHTHRARVSATAHNGATTTLRPKLRAQCKGKAKGVKGKRRRAR
jgi:hypothetical protein